MVLDNDDALNIMFVVSLILSSVLVLISTAAFGRQLSDLDYQLAAKLNGIRRTQSWINLRIHFNRIAFALAFTTTSILGLFDIEYIIRTWVGRSLFLLVLIGYVFSSILDWRGERKQLKALVENSDSGNIPVLRFKAHAFNNKLAIITGLAELLKENKDSITQDDIIALNHIVKEMDEQFKDIHKTIRALDPNYYIRPEMKEDNNESGKVGRPI